SAGERVQAVQVERRIEVSSIYERMLNTPKPQGFIDENSPWLHFRIPVAKTKKGEPSEISHRLYYFELSQDSAFQGDVIKSGAKRWSFYNPYRLLNPGKWFWRYAYGLDDAPDKLNWSDRIYSFVVTGKERKVLPPSPQKLIDCIMHTKGPHVEIGVDEIGSLLPDTHPEIKKSLLNSFEKLLKDPVPVIAVDTTVYPRHLSPSGIRRHFTLKTLDQFTQFANRVRTLLNAYLLTADPRYKQKGLDELYALDREYYTTMMTYGKRPGFPDDFVVEQYTKTMNLVLDAFAEDLSPEWRNKIVESLYAIKRDGYLNFYKQLEFSEHVVYKAHLWQMCVHTLLTSAIVLAPYKEEARLWMEYAYELWLYRNPAAGRNDGGWHAGNGYFGANERQLVATPHILGRLTGYNYFDHPWYQNVAKYLSYSAPYGNPGVAFGDAVGYIGCSQMNLVEYLAYLYPQNYWSLWRMKSFEQNNTNIKRKFRLSQESEIALLSVWKKYKKPDYKNIKEPEEFAALFPDIGYVGMHTDMLDPQRNMLVNFRSCPFGQLNHAHPAQNAFNIAYGDEPLFWRTGHYATTAEHSAQSFKHSRAHNTILADGAGQVCDVSGYGWIPRFVTGDNISYALGDASHAYTLGDNEVPGYKEPGVTRFRRHIARLKPSYVVIYDELEAREPVLWTFRLNARDNMQMPADNIISTYNKYAQASAYVFSTTSLTGSITDKFVADPIDIQGKRTDGKDRYPNHWHASVTTKEKLKKYRFLTLVEVTPNGQHKIFSGRLLQNNDNYVSLAVGNYIIEAQLDSNKPSLLVIKNEQDSCALLSGQDSESLLLNNKLHKVENKGATLFVEKGDTDKTKVVEVIDTLPDAAIFGNQY
ncbi:MAG: DUF4962 domain-containing protein, partial [Bacteroidales bacterium]